MFGLTAAIQGFAYFGQGGNLAVGALLPACLLLAGGAAILVGFLTPLVSPIAGVLCLGIALSWFSAPVWNLVGSKLEVAELVTLSVVLALLGPGAYSLDARLFGWREIVIPPAQPPQD